MAKLDSFEEFLAGTNGSKIAHLYGRFQDIDGSKFRNESLGVFTWGQDSVDIREGYLSSNLTGSGARWAAFLYLAYVKLCRKNGVTPGEFTDEWNDIFFEDDE